MNNKLISIGTYWVVSNKLDTVQVQQVYRDLQNEVIDFDDIQFPLVDITKSRHSLNDWLYHYVTPSYLIATLNASSYELILMSLLIEKLDKLVA